MNFGCENLNDSGTCIGSLASTRSILFLGSLVIRDLALFLSFVGEKNDLWCLRPYSSHLLRPEDTPGSRLALRRPAHLSGRGDPPGLLPKVRESEAREAGLACRLSLFHQAVCLLRWPPLPGCEYFGYRQGAPPGLAHGQSVGDAVSQGAVAAGGEAWAQGCGHR